MPGTTFYPRRDIDLVRWSIGLRDRLLSDPFAYGQSPEGVAGLVDAQRAFEAAYREATRPATRTVVAVSLKNTLRARMKREAGAVVGAIQSRLETTNAQRVTLGLTVPAGARRHGRPTQMPAVSVRRVSGKTVSLRVKQGPDAEDGRPRPVGVSGARVYTFVGRTPPRSLEAGWRYAGTFGRRDVTLTLGEEVRPGAFVWFTACWVNAKDQAGPESVPVMTRTNFEGLYGATPAAEGHPPEQEEHVQRLAA